MQVLQDVWNPPNPGLRFKVTIPQEELAFNQTQAMDLMYLNGVPVLHVVDIGTDLGNAAALNGSTVEDAWEKLGLYGKRSTQATRTNCEWTAEASLLPPAELSIRIRLAFHYKLRGSRAKIRVG